MDAQLIFLAKMRERYEESEQNYKATIDQLQEKIRDLETKLEWEEKRKKGQEKYLKKPENIFALFEDVKITPKMLSDRRISCGWSAYGEVCKTPATNCLPRPAIFVCDKHCDEWNRAVDKSNAIGGREAHKKRERSE